MDQRRNRRLRLLISRLNKERKKQAKQIDILCNDLIAAQKHFIKSLKVIGFAADFYEAVMGITELNELLGAAANLIRDQILDANIAFFLITCTASLTGGDNFEMHIFESDQPIDLLTPSKTDGEEKRIETFFTKELVDNIAQSNRICGLDDMLTMGLTTNPRYLEKVSAAAVPLNHHGSSLGFILLYRAGTSPFTPEELQSIDHVSTGLARAIAGCRSRAASLLA